MTRAETVTRCPACGSLAVRPRAAAGRTRSYKVFPLLPLPDDLLIPTCRTCRSEWPDTETQRRLGAVLRKSFEALLRHMAWREIERLSLHLSLRRLERLLGLAQGYLSRLSAGDGNPSVQLVLLLRILADGAPEILTTIDRFWALAPIEEELEMVQEKTKQHRGFAAMDREAHRELARSGGKASHEYGLAYAFDTDTAREAGKKGGATTAQNRVHQAAAGRRGGLSLRTKLQIVRRADDVLTDEDRQAAKLARQALKQLPVPNRGALARLLGLSRVMLRQLIKGEEIPARPLVALILLLSQHPEVIPSLSSLWKQLDSPVQPDQRTDELISCPSDG